MRRDIACSSSIAATQTAEPISFTSNQDDRQAPWLPTLDALEAAEAGVSFEFVPIETDVFEMVA